MVIKQKVRLGIYGGGKQAEEHILALRDHPSACLVGIKEIDQPRCAYLRSKYGSDIILEPEESWENRNIQGLILCLPHDVYAEKWDTFLDCQVPLLKEKPLGRTPEEALNFLDRCHERGVPLQTAIQRRKHPSYLKLKEFLQNEEIEGIKALMHLGHKRNSVPTDEWRNDKVKSGGGALLDSGYHLVDLVLFLGGPFRLLSSHIVSSGRLWQNNWVDDEAHLMGIVNSTWVSIESKTFTSEKIEFVEVQTKENKFRATRMGVWKNETQLFSCEREWQSAMQQQIQDFVNNITHHSFETPEIRDQFPAMRIIAQAYHQNGGSIL